MLARRARIAPEREWQIRQFDEFDRGRTLFCRRCGHARKTCAASSKPTSQFFSLRQSESAQDRLEREARASFGGWAGG